MSPIPLTIDAVLSMAVDQLRSRRGLDPEEFLRRHPDHAGDLARLLPVLVSLGVGRISEAMDRDDLLGTLEFHYRLSAA